MKIKLKKSGGNGVVVNVLIVIVIMFNLYSGIIILKNALAAIFFSALSLKRLAQGF